MRVWPCLNKDRRWITVVIIAANGILRKLNLKRDNVYFLFAHTQTDSSWWGTKRIDYMTHSPEGLQQFPVSTLIQLCYNSYWESKDIVTFIVWQVRSKQQRIIRGWPGLEWLVSQDFGLSRKFFLQRKTNLVFEFAKVFSAKFVPKITKFESFFFSKRVFSFGTRKSRQFLPLK